MAGLPVRGTLNLKPLPLPVACLSDTLLKCFGLEIVPKEPKKKAKRG
jgi:hypothetical protein